MTVPDQPATRREHVPPLPHARPNARTLCPHPRTKWAPRENIDIGGSRGSQSAFHPSALT